MHQVQTRPEMWTLADLVTGIRFLLAAVLAVTAGADGARWLVGALAATALLTDFVDGRLARATKTVTARGGRLDAEADAALILVLSTIVARNHGWWILSLGLARYAFGLLFLLVPALSSPPQRARPWARVVAATGGVVLAVVAAVPLPGWCAGGAVLVVTVLLAESFLHEAVDRWRAPLPPVSLPHGTVAAFGVVWVSLACVAVAAPTAHGGGVHAALGVPVEFAVVVVLGLLPGRRLRSAMAAIAGVALGVLLVLAVLDRSFEMVLDRAFQPLEDWSLLGPGVGVLGDSIGMGWARAVAAGAGAGVLALLLVLALALVRLVDVARETRPYSLRVGVLLGAAALLSAAFGIPVVSTGATTLTVSEVSSMRAEWADHRAFARAIGHDPYAGRAARDPGSLLAGLAGKDVLVVFVESYGRASLQDPTYGPRIRHALAAGTRELGAAGYGTRSALATSPTFGAGSWLAHATLQSGLWVNTQANYRQLLGSRRMTLTRLFAAAGWDTVFDVPADTRDWPEGQAFYGFAHYSDSRNVGYAGPKFGYAPVPDQYTLAQFRRRHLSPAPRKPVMAEIDLVSSHHPWTPLPRMVPWDELGDGSIYHQPGARGASVTGLADAQVVKRMYGESIEYTWRALTSFLTTYPDPDLVLVVLGDHQPHSYVSGEHAGRDVPISIIAHDPAVLRRTDQWGWQPGLAPAPDAVVWPMNVFRDRFLSAFSTG